jgi:hypothetical protein
MNLKQQFTTVTRFSKIIALILFISLPFIGFYAGIKFQAPITTTGTTPTIAVPSFNPKVSSMPILPSSTPVTSKNSSYKIIETKTFSEIPGFSFEYLVFQGWEVREVKKINDSQYSILFNFPEGNQFYVPPSMFIEKTTSMVTDYLGASKNPNGVPYYQSTQNKKVLSFFIPDEVKINLSSIVDGDGISKKEMENKIIESFKFTK